MVLRNRIAFLGYDSRSGRRIVEAYLSKLIPYIGTILYSSYLLSRIPLSVAILVIISKFDYFRG